MQIVQTNTPIRRMIFLFILFCFGSKFMVAQDNSFTGYATAKIENGKTTFNTFGYKDQNKTQSYDKTTIQPIGSVSKIIIGLALMKAQELGMLDLNEDINHYLDFKLINPNLKSKSPITLKDLATHTSGILDNEKFYFQSYAKTLVSSESLGDYLKSYLDKEGRRYSKKNFGKQKPGEEYNYSNIGAALAAYVVEQTTKMSFDQFTQNYIFQPLEMTDTHWFYRKEQMDSYSQLFDEKDQALDFYSLTTYPDGGLKTDIVDLSKLLKTLMDGYQGNSDFLKKESWAVFYTRYFSGKSVKGINTKEPDSGIFIVYSRSGSIGHTGSDPGVSTLLAFNPESNTGKIFMANEDITPKNIEMFKEIWSDL